MDNIFKGLLVIALLGAVYHYIYAHYMMGNSPPEMLLLIGILVIVNVMVFTNKIIVKDRK